MPSIIPEPARPADAPSPESSLAEQNQWWLAWWDANADLFHKVGNEEAHDLLERGEVNLWFDPETSSCNILSD